MVLTTCRFSRIEKYLVPERDNSDNCNFICLRTLRGIRKVVSHVFYIALYVCCTRLIFSIQTHEDIDRDDYGNASPSAWRRHLNSFHKLINERVLLQESDKVDINVQGFFFFERTTWCKN